MIQVCTKRLRAWLQSRYLPWHLAVLAMLLCIPSLGLGWQFDDDFHRAALTRPDLPLLSRSPAELFAYIKGDEQANRWSIAFGMYPWWASEDLRISFYRPLTGFLHWVDYKLWPELPSLMHLHSLVWYGAVVVAATLFYRRMLGATWVAGLAALLFAVDDAHGMPAVWLANRNALIGAFFGLLTLIAYDRWRRDGWWIGAVVAPAAFLTGLLAKESTLAVAAYLLAYALFLDRSTWVRRLCSLAPCALVGLLWLLAYKNLGYGAAGSGWYLDPSTEPLRFAQAAAVRAPTLLAWQWLVPSDVQWELSPAVAQAMWFAALGLLVIVAVALAPLVKRDAVARFWVLGMTLSLLPICAVYPADRLLFFVGIGGMGLLSQLIAAVAHRAERPVTQVWRRLPVRALCILLIIIHLGAAPVALARTADYMESYGRIIARAAASLPSGPAAPFKTVLIVQTPTYSTFSYGSVLRWLDDEPYLSRTLVLGSGGGPIEISRPDEHTLIVRPEGGFLAPVGGSTLTREMGQVLFDQRNAFLTLDRLFSDGRSMEIGRQIKVTPVTVEVTAVTDDGRPAEVTYHFVMSLENPLLLWLKWRDGEYVPFKLPSVGEMVTLPAVTIPY